MSRFTKSLSVFMAGLALTGTKIQAAQQEPGNPFESTLDPTSLRPLNMPGDNMYAAHRSHSSHSSHSSHRSSSGSYSVPKRSQSSSSDSSYKPSTGSSQSVDPGRPATVTSTGRDFDPNEQALMDLVRRVQLALIVKGYSPGAVDGILGSQTRVALKHFQADNGLEVDGRMGTPTLNALGVVARQ